MQLGGCGGQIEALQNVGGGGGLFCKHYSLSYNFIFCIPKPRGRQELTWDICPLNAALPTV